ncbi:MAG: long-chain fatty acid--CoA ligase [Clostridia bacterium]|nr:long-chain fatty acid--CoA ligase [Clostridia bacterium]
METLVGSIYKNNYKENKVAISFKGENITYGQLDKAVCGYAAFFRSKGLKPHDKTVLLCTNSPEFVYCYLGIVKNGGIIIPANLMLTIEELTHIVKDSEASRMLIHPTVLKKTGRTTEEISAALGVDVFVIDEKMKKEALAMASGDAAEFKEPEDENEVCTLLYTSGTTGKQKAAMLTHKNLVINSSQCHHGLAIVSEDDVYMCVLPMFHVFAFTACILMPLWEGATTVILEEFQPKEVIASLVRDDITVFMGVPAMYIVLLEAGKKNIKFPKLRMAISGGASLPVEIYRQCKEILRLPIVEGYGLTEAAPGAAFNPVDKQKEGSIGLPLPTIDAKIFDDNDCEVGCNVVGELVLRGENVMKGYYNQPEETAKALKNGWLHTGDLARMDEDGYIFIVDRKKDMVVVSGMNVYPREIEEVIFKHPKVKETAVIGVHDRLRGEKVKAFVVLKEGEECTSSEISAFLKERLAAFKLPKNIEFVDSLPKNGSGKILKKLLKEQHSA